MIDWLPRYVGVLLVTIAIEVPVAALVGLRRRDEIAAVALVSAFTFPMLSLAMAVMPTQRYPDLSQLGMILSLELNVVLIEWRLLVWALKRESRMLVASLLMNVASFLIGASVLGLS